MIITLRDEKRGIQRTLNVKDMSVRDIVDSVCREFFDTTYFELSNDHYGMGISVNIMASQLKRRGVSLLATDAASALGITLQFRGTC